MAQGGEANSDGVIFREGRVGQRQRKKYEALQNREILSTRYVDDTCLCHLGLFDRIYWMIDMVGSTNFLHVETLHMLDWP